MRDERAGAMRLLEVVPHIDREASGPSYSVPALCDSLAERGHRVTLATLAREDPVRLRAYHHESYPPFWGMQRLGLSPRMHSGLVREAQTADLVHSHSLWMMPNVYPAWAAARAGKPLIVSPRGTLSSVALRRSRLRKRLLWTLLQARAVRAAACLHATSEQEYLDIRAAGLTQPVTVIPNGVEIPPATAAWGRPTRRLLYLGRIHPIKGLSTLLESWRRIAPRFPEWELRLVGPDSDDHLRSLRQICENLSIPRVTFAGEKYGAEKTAEYYAADLYVLPSWSENFGMSVAEALAHARPVVTTTGTPWQSLETQHCGWWVAPSPEAMAATLSEAMALTPDSLRRMGENGRQWMAEHFSWQRVAADMESTYRWVIGGGDLPPTVRLG